MFDEKRCEELRQLVHATLNDLTWIGTEVSDDRGSINLIISLASKTVKLPISIEDIMVNHCSCKGFLALLTEPLESVLVPYLELGAGKKETVDAV